MDYLLVTLKLKVDFVILVQKFLWVILIFEMEEALTIRVFMLNQVFNLNLINFDEFLGFDYQVVVILFVKHFMHLVFLYLVQMEVIMIQVVHLYLVQTVDIVPLHLVQMEVFNHLYSVPTVVIMLKTHYHLVQMVVLMHSMDF